MASAEGHSADPIDTDSIDADGQARLDHDLTAARAVAVCAMLWAAAGIAVWRFIDARNADLTDYVIPWYDYLIAHGRFAALGAGFADYTPPYLYLLSLASLAESALDPAVAIRLINIPFLLFAGWIIYRLARRSGRGRDAAAMAALLFAALPETVINCIVWGQSDIIFTAFVLAFLLLILEDRPWSAAVMLSIAFAIKLQTIFVAPLVLALLLLRNLSWWQLVCGPVVYTVLALPAAVAGRPWQDLLTIYVDQVKEATFEGRVLSLNAANPYSLIQRMLPEDLVDFTVIMGAVLGIIAGLVLAIAFIVRPPRTPAALLLCATMSLLVVPFVLPKMHERYFFLANATAFALAVARPGLWRVVGLLQLAAILTYSASLGVPHHLSLLAPIPVSVAIFLLLRLFVEQPASVKERILRPAGFA